MESLPQLQAVATGIAAGGQVYQGLAGARIAGFNAAMAESQARRVLANGDTMADRYRQQVKGVVGSQRAGYAAQGVSVDSGSPVEVMEDTFAIGEADAEMIRHNAAMEAMGLQVEAQNFRAAGRQGRVKGFADAIGTSLAGGANAIYTSRGLTVPRYTGGGF